MTSRWHRSSRAGFSLVELLAAMTLTTLVAAGLLTLFTRQLDFYRTEDALRDARVAARAAMNVLTTDLRMVETGGGVVAATQDAIEVRVPVAFGLVCQSTAGNVVVSFMPSDSMTVASASVSGWAWRNQETEGWLYREGEVTRTAGGAPQCAAAGVTILPGGRAVEVQPGEAGLDPGTPVMLYQRVRFHFDDSAALPGRRGLFRTVVDTNQTDELSSPFTATARFRFFVGWSDPQDAPPADLTQLRGVEVVLDSESVNVLKDGNPEDFALRAAIYFRNRID